MLRINLTDHFLIAMPAMTDPYFNKSLVYIAEHNEHGALGIIVNRPLDMNLLGLLEKIEIKYEAAVASTLVNLPVFFGGPVQTDRGFVLHRPQGQWQSTLPVNAEIGLTSSRDILQSVAAFAKPADVLVSLGYSGWGYGQLEQELADNAWLTVPADPHILFEVPNEGKLPSAMEKLGIDFTHLAENAGHA